MARLLLSCLLLALSLSACGDIEDEASVASLTISPTSVTVGINQPQAFNSVAKNSLGIIVQITPTWSTAGGIGSISSTGIFTAGSATGEGTVTASYGGYTASATVTITNNGWVVGWVTGDWDAGGVGNLLVAIRGSNTLNDYTDSNGYYSIADIPAGSYEVYTQTNHQIYLSASEEVTITNGETVVFSPRLTVKPGLSTVPTTTLPTI